MDDIVTELEKAGFVESSVDDEAKVAYRLMLKGETPERSLAPAGDEVAVVVLEALLEEEGQP